MQYKFLFYSNYILQKPSIIIIKIIKDFRDAIFARESARGYKTIGFFIASA